MSKKNQVFTCLSPSCQTVLFQGTTLLEVSTPEGNFSLNPTLGHLEYYSEDGEKSLKVELRGNTYKFVKAPTDVSCPNCKGAATRTTVSVDFGIKPQEVMKTLDNIDAQINDLLNGVFKER